MLVSSMRNVSVFKSLSCCSGSVGTFGAGGSVCGCDSSSSSSAGYAACDRFLDTDVECVSVVSNISFLRTDRCEVISQQSFRQNWCEYMEARRLRSQ